MPYCLWSKNGVTIGHWRHHLLESVISGYPSQSSVAMLLTQWSWEAAASQWQRRLGAGWRAGRHGYQNSHRGGSQLRCHAWSLQQNMPGESSFSCLPKISPLPHYLHTKIEYRNNVHNSLTQWYRPNPLCCTEHKHNLITTASTSASSRMV
jgi:hypothetical protein